MLDGYEVDPGLYDEAFEGPGRPRPHYVPLLEALAVLDLDEMERDLTARLSGAGVTFGESETGLLALDLVPRLLTPSEWTTISVGVLQRARALDRFAADVYGERAIVAAGILPERVIQSSAHYEPAMRGGEGPPTWVSIVGFDLVRGPDGEFGVLEDQIRMPSGLAYAAAAREVLPELLGVAPAADAGMDTAFVRLADALREAAPEPAEDPSIVVLSSGRDGAGWYEHERIGRELGVPVVTLDRLERRRGGALGARVEDGTIPVDVVYQRTDEDRFTDGSGRPTALGEALLEPCRTGRIACVNAPGSGIGDDKLVHGYVDEMVGFYLDEDPALRSVGSYDLGVDARRAAALERMNEMVFKPRAEMGGEGVVVWSHADDAERDQVRRSLDDSPQELIAQRRVELSSHPTVRGGRLRPRRVDLRPYVIRTPDREWVTPGLTRVALDEGSLIVNSSRGGGVKDTWLAGEPPSPST
ncbi:MAG TPA: circularly permuted type 2 ATP-grasp protein [Solirubrobacterales bacterium]|jgi:carboxylate-amine ligase|nr:circularly permuted type 2 ATP-grasp protein [Solirubrobacterales bacterium]